MNITTLLKYLIGNRDAIQKIANQSQLLWVGVLFVFSAGFAREYDAEDLLHEPWYLLIPLVASIASSLLLYAFIFFVYPTTSENKLGDRLSYKSFLTLYWMTAPLAWLYALPAERLFSAGNAVQFNLYLLLFVSVWRVLLISRVISVLCRSTFLAALFIVMLFADGLALFILYLTPLPVFNIMGGIHLTEGEHVIQGTAFLVGILGVVSFPIWLLGSVVTWWPTKFQKNLTTENSSITEAIPVSTPLWILAIVSLLIWCFILPITQPEQQNRRQVEKFLKAKQYKEAVTFMSSLKRNDFPPHWNPPPHIGYGERSEVLADVIDATITSKSAPWVQDLYLQKIKFYFSFVRMHSINVVTFGLREMKLEQLDRIVTFLESRPDDGPELAASLFIEIQQTVSPIDIGDTDTRKPDISIEQREQFIRLLNLAKQHEEANKEEQDNERKLDLIDQMIQDLIPTVQ